MNSESRGVRQVVTPEPLPFREHQSPDTSPDPGA